jgi:thiamine biosynthesis lipoprotein
MLLSACGCTAATPPPGDAHPATGPARTRYEYERILMGVQVRLVMYTTDENTAKTAAKAAFDRVAELEEVMSDYQRDSEVMRLCDRARAHAATGTGTGAGAGADAGGSGPVRVSEDLFRVLAFAQEVSQASDGAFDVTVGPVVQLWRAARRSGKLPDAAALSEARKKVGYRLVKLERRRRTVELAAAGMRLDLGGIGKGDAGDQAQKVLRAHGVASALFEAGGDIVVSDAPPDRPAGWLIETQDGRRIDLANAAVSTSGKTEQFVEMNGISYSHVVDPRSGIGLTSQFAATVIARRGITSDALSTAATVLGPERSAALFRRFDARGWVRKVEVETTSRQTSTTSRVNP